MSPTRLSVVVVVAVVLTAGCGGVAVDTDGSAAADSLDTPPGMEADRVTDPAALTSAHGTVLSNRSYTTAQATTVTFGNGTVYAEHVRNATVAGPDSYRLSVTQGGTRTPVGYGSRVAFYVDGDTERQLVVGWDGNRTVRQEPVGFVGRDDSVGRLLQRRDIGNEDSLYQLLASAETQTVEPQAQQGRYRVVLGGVTPAAPSFVADAGPANATLHVTPEGVVTELVVTYTATVGDDSVRVRTVVQYDDIGTASVDRSEWAERE